MSQQRTRSQGPRDVEDNKVGESLTTTKQITAERSPETTSSTR